MLYLTELYLSVNVCHPKNSQTLVVSTRLVSIICQFSLYKVDLLMFFIIYENNTHLNHIVHIHVTSFTHSYMNYPVYRNELLTNDTIFCLTNE